MWRVGWCVSHMWGSPSCCCIHHGGGAVHQKSGPPPPDTRNTHTLLIWSRRLAKKRRRELQRHIKPEPHGGGRASTLCDELYLDIHRLSQFGFNIFNHVENRSKSRSFGAVCRRVILHAPGLRWVLRSCVILECHWQITMHHCQCIMLLHKHLNNLHYILLLLFYYRHHHNNSY